MAPFEASAAAQIDEILKKYTQDPYTQVPRVVVAAASSKEVLYTGMAGYEHLPPHPATPEQLAEATKIKDDSIFELFSCTKLVGVIATLQLVEQGKIAVHDPASKFLPELKELKLVEGFEEDGTTPIFTDPESPVTIEHLITHTAGYTYPFYEPHQKTFEYLDIPAPNKEGATKESLTKLPVFFPPGKRWHYGLNNDVLTLVVEAVSGLTLEDYFQANIFKPLGITDISYVPNPNKISMSYAPAPYKFDAGATTGPVQNSGGSGLQGSAPSYLKIIQAILNGGALEGAGRILKEETVDLMFQGHLSANEEDRKVQLEELTKFATESDPFAPKRGGQLPGSVDWGYGGLLTGLDGKSYTHGRAPNTLCWSGYANTFWAIDREKDLAFVLFYNTIPYHNGPAFESWAEIEPLIYSGAGKA